MALDSFTSFTIVLLLWLRNFSYAYTLHESCDQYASKIDASWKESIDIAATARDRILQDGAGGDIVQTLLKTDDATTRQTASGFFNLATRFSKDKQTGPNWQDVMFICTDSVYSEWSNQEGNKRNYQDNVNNEKTTFNLKPSQRPCTKHAGWTYRLLNGKFVMLLCKQFPLDAKYPTIGPIFRNGQQWDGKAFIPYFISNGKWFTTRTIVHELFHAANMVNFAGDPAYGWDQCTGLSTGDALRNADTFALLGMALSMRNLKWEGTKVKYVSSPNA